VWHYIVDFAHLFNPFPNLGGLAEDIRFYRDIGAEGVYLQGWGCGRIPSASALLRDEAPLESGSEC
jgi:hypothetical protein